MKAGAVHGPRSLEDFLEIAWKTVEVGSNLLATSQPSMVRRKGDRDLVTDVDLAVQHQIAELLVQHTPDIELLAEESEEQPDIGATEWLWVLDPIDGTSNFAHGLPMCAVSLALLRNGDPVVSVTKAPLLHRTYHAVKGVGAFLDGKPITASGAGSLNEAIVSLGDYAVGPGADTHNRQRLRLTAELVPTVERIRMVGAATLDLAFVAEGSLDACVMLSNKPWDTAAGVLLAREAGALVTDVRGAPHTYRSDSTVATTPAIAHELAGILQSSSRNVHGT